MLLGWVAGKGAAGRRALRGPGAWRRIAGGVDREVDGGSHFLTGPARRGDGPSVVRRRVSARAAEAHPPCAPPPPGGGPSVVRRRVSAGAAEARRFGAQPAVRGVLERLGAARFSRAA